MNSVYQKIFKALPEFLQDLRSSGFVIGPDRETKLIAFLTKMSMERALPTNSEQLGNQMGCVLCSSEEHQAKFKQRFRLWFGTWNIQGLHPLIDSPGIIGDSSAEALPDDNKEQSLESEKEPAASKVSKFSLQNMKKAIVRYAAAIAFVLIGMIAISIINQFTYKAGKPSNKTPQESKKSFNGNQEADIPSKAQENTRRSDVEIITRPLISGFNYLKGNLKDFQDRFGVWVFLIIVIPFVFIALWIIAPARAKSAFISQQNIIGKTSLLNLLLESNRRLLFSDRRSFKNAQALRHPIKIQSEILEVNATISQTIRNAGYFSPAFADRKISPEYLVLIERLGGGDHQCVLAEDFVIALQTAGIYVESYYFRDDARRCYQTPGQPSVNLSDLADRTSNYRLIVLSTGDGFFDPFSGSLKEWTSTFLRWSSRALITTRPQDEWHRGEWILSQNLGFFVVSLGNDTITMLAKFFNPEDPDKPPTPNEPDDLPGSSIAKMFDFLEERPLRWFDPTPPAPAVANDLLTLLGSMCGGSGMTWLAACAIFPRLKSAITQHIGSVIKTEDGRPLWHRKTLFTMARLPWFREGRMPLWLRVSLIHTLSPAMCSRVNIELDNLLMTISSKRHKDFSLSLALNEQRDGKFSVDDQNDIQTDLLDDPLLLEFFRSTHSGTGDFKVSSRLARVLGLKRKKTSMQDLRATLLGDNLILTADVLAAELNDLSIKTMTIVPLDPEIRDTYGPEFRKTTGYINSDNSEVIIPDNRLLYLPGWSAQRKSKFNATYLDRATAEFFLHRRRISVRLSFISSGFLTIILYFTSTGYFEGITIPLFGIAALSFFLLVPFVIFHSLIVKPIRHAIDRFPKVPLTQS